MPSEFKLPARTERYCEPCEFHKCTGALFTRIGPGGWKQYVCTHPKAFEPMQTFADPEKQRLAEKLAAINARDGRQIGKTEKQPDWCPLRRERTSTHD